MPQPDHLIGTTLGSYRLTRVLGVGGMGAVYLGQHPEIESKVAIKLLLPEYVEHEEIVRRFLDEARAVNRIGHPGIVQIHDSARHPTLGVYLVMEYLEGETLYQLSRRAGPLDPGVTCRLLQQAAAALQASHREGIVHRDLKPANLFLVPDAEVVGGIRVKVLDFGIAKLAEQRDPGSGGTETGAFLGSPMFMSPEQCLDSKEVDYRTDIYSLGAIAYHVLCGRYPFEAPSVGKLILAHQQQQPRPLGQLNSAVSAELEAVIHRALATDRERRFQSMEELRDALLALLEDRGDQAARALAATLGTDPGAGELPPTAHEPVEAPPDDAAAALPPTLGEGSVPIRPTTTLSGAAGESTARAEAQVVSWSRSTKLALGLTAAVLVVIVALLLGRSPEQPPAAPVSAAQPGAADSAAAQPASQPAARPAAPDAAPTQLTLTLDISPSKARVLLDGRRVTARQLRLPASDEPHTLRVSAPGHLTHKQRLTLRKDKTLNITLQRLRRPAAAQQPARPAPRPAPASEPKRPKPRPRKPYFDDL